MASFQRGITFATNGTVTAENLHNLVDQTTPRAGIITDRSVLATMSTADRVLIADTDDATNAYFITTGSLIGQGLAGTTYAGASFTAGTIATFNSTTGTVTNLVAPTLNSTTGTVTNLVAPTLNSTSGTVTTLNSTTGTITNLTTTLAGDFTISGGTGTLGTTGVTAGTYGTSTIIPRISVDSKGRITTIGTSGITTGKILQVVEQTYSTEVTVTSSSYTDTGLSASITPSSASSKILVHVRQQYRYYRAWNEQGVQIKLLRDSTDILTPVASEVFFYASGNANEIQSSDFLCLMKLDSPNTTSSVTYKTQGRPETTANSGSVKFQHTSAVSSIILMEVAG